MNITAIIAAGGESTRMNGTNKLLEEVGGKALLLRTTEAFLDIEQIDQIIIVASKKYTESYMKLMHDAGYLDKVNFIIGGRSRRESVYNGLHETNKNAEIVLIHDAARPLVTKELIIDCIEAAQSHGACCAAVPLFDTLKKAGTNGFVKKTISRENMYRVQTPQAFKFRDIKRLHEKAATRGLDVTDDAQIAEYFGYHVFIVESNETNIKITNKEDLVIANAILSSRNNTGAEDSFTPAEHGELFSGGSGETDTAYINGE